MSTGQVLKTSVVIAIALFGEAVCAPRSQVSFGAQPSRTPGPGQADSVVRVSPHARYAGVQARMDEAASRGEPIVVHVIVCLADNEHQGIVPVKPASLAVGDRPEQNLYWGARFGLMTFMASNGWRKVCNPVIRQEEILRKVLFERVLTRQGRPVTVELVAEAWRGDAMPRAIERFLILSGGKDGEWIKYGGKLLAAGGNAHLVIFIGHNGLMDTAPLGALIGSASPARSAAVFACLSDSYFRSAVERCGANPVLLTRSLMAPEAYGPDALIRSFAAGEPPREIEQSVATAYARHQKCSLRAARSLFCVSE